MKKLLMSSVLIFWSLAIPSSAAHLKPSRSEVDAEILWQKILVFLSRFIVPEDKIFEGWHFVIDAGHGDNDPGAVRVVKIFNQEFVYAESAMTLDIARRLGWYLRRRGASGVYFTLGPAHLVKVDAIDKYSYWHWANPPPPVMIAHSLLPAHFDAASGDEAALTTRSQVGQQKVKTYGGKKTIFLSIHIDSVSSSVGGMSFYAARGSKSELILSLKQAAVEAGLVRKKKNHSGSYFPLGKADFVVIKKQFNSSREALLIETANLHNGNFKEGDFARLIVAQGREQIARVIGQGLAAFCQKYE